MSRHKEWEQFGTPLLKRLRIFQQGTMGAMIILQRRSHHLSRRGVLSSIQNGRPPDRGHRSPHHFQDSIPIPYAPIRWCTPAMIRSAACPVLSLPGQTSSSSTEASSIFLIPARGKRLMRLRLSNDGSMMAGPMFLWFVPLGALKANQNKMSASLAKRLAEQRLEVFSAVLAACEIHEGVMKRT